VITGEKAGAGGGGGGVLGTHTHAPPFHCQAIYLSVGKRPEILGDLLGRDLELLDNPDNLVVTDSAEETASLTRKMIMIASKTTITRETPTNPASPILRLQLFVISRITQLWDTMFISFLASIPPHLRPLPNWWRLRESDPCCAMDAGRFEGGRFCHSPKPPTIRLGSIGEVGDVLIS
jgi:hypothetical protein